MDIENEELKRQLVNMTEAAGELLGLSFKAEHAWESEDYNLQQKCRKVIESDGAKSISEVEA